MTDSTNHPTKSAMNTCPDPQVERLLVQLRQRQRVRQSLIWLCHGALAGAVLASAVALTAVVVSPDTARAFGWPCVLAIPAIALLSAGLGWIRRVDDLTVARALDRSANSEDRFASALQLADHHRKSRVRLVVEDALARVSGTTSRAAIPLIAPRILRWVPVPLIILAAIFWLAPGGKLSAQPPQDPEVSDEEWAEVHEEFEQELAVLPEPKTDEDRELADELRRLAELLKERPDKREALARIAELRAELERRQQGLGTSQLSMRQAANAIQSSTLQQLAAMLQQGNYQGAADEMKNLADRLEKNEQNMSAAEFEEVAADFDAMSAELSSHSELSQGCQKCAAAASSMNRQSLANSLRQFSKSLNKNARQLRSCDSLCKGRNMLDRLTKRLNQCRGGKCGNCKNCGNGKCSGNCSAFVKNSNKKGGLRAGWGTADNWASGRIAPADEQRIGEMVDVQETGGRSDTFATVSPDERAQSAQEDRDRYVDLIRKAEADLDLESIPLAYRDYLRRYFVSIRPADGPAEPAPH
jgi:hypothetical protein